MGVEAESKLDELEILVVIEGVFGLLIRQGGEHVGVEAESELDELKIVVVIEGVLGLLTWHS